MATDLLWAGGWYRHARRLASPNFGPRPEGACVDLLVMHSISLPPGDYGGTAVLELFCNALDWEAHPYYATIRDIKVSAHFFVRRNGELWQLVSCDDRAWHAGKSAYRGRTDCNDDSIGIELEGVEGEPFVPAQYECLEALAAALASRYPIAHVAGHEHIAPGRKGDPGAGFDWAAFQCRMAWPDRFFPAPLQPSPR